MSGEQDIRHMGGLKSKMPVTYWTFLAGTLALAGVPGLAGFFSKDEILWKTFSGGQTVLWLVGLIAAFCTAFYMFRLVYLTFHGKFRGSKAAEHHLHESPRVMTVPLMVLAVLSVIGGYIGLPHVLGGTNPFGQWLDPVMRSGVEGEVIVHHGEAATELTLMIVSVLIALAGIYLAHSWYMKKSETLKTLGESGLHTVLLNKYWVDEIYSVTIVQPFVKGSELLARYFDVGTIDGLVNGVGSFFSWVGGGVRRVQTGVVQNYALFMGIGLLAVLTVFLVTALG
jgi:NADH-quinone oxidoreductase subunit L